MLMRFLSIAFLLLAILDISQVTLAAPPTVQAPEKIYGEAGDWVFFKVTTDSKQVTKIVSLTDGLELFPSEKLKDPTEHGVRARKSGTYKLLVYTGNAEGPSEPRFIQVTFGGNTIPDDDDKKPPPPPIDPLLKEFVNAYGSINETEFPDKRERLRQLVLVMKESAEYAKDANIVTNQALTNKVASQTQEKVGLGNLLPVRKVIGAYLNKEMGTTLITLDATNRAKYVELYTKIAKLLDSIE